MASSALSSVDYALVSRSQHYRYLGLSNSLLSGGGEGVLFTVRCFRASLDSTLQMPVAPLPTVTKKKLLDVDDAHQGHILRIVH